MDQTTPKPFVFVLMPFTHGFDDIYSLGIKAACGEAGAYAERVDEQIFTESILQRVFNQISKADLIVSDMTGRNPNVFYETGYAHALGKTVILLTQDANDIPFDLKHYSHIVYRGSIISLKDELTKVVRWHLDNPTRLAAPALEELEYFINGTKVEEGAFVKAPFSRSSRPSCIRMNLDIHNPGRRLADFSRSDFSVMLPPEFTPPSPQSIPLPDGRVLCKLRPFGELLPGCWQTVELSFFCTIEGAKDFSHRRYHATLVVSTEISQRSVDFTFAVVVENVGT